MNINIVTEKSIQHSSNQQSQRELTRCRSEDLLWDDAPPTRVGSLHCNKHQNKHWNKHWNNIRTNIRTNIGTNISPDDLTKQSNINQLILMIQQLINCFHYNNMPGKSRDKKFKIANSENIRIDKD